jgi:hypothetical protein
MSHEQLGLTRFTTARTWGGNHHLPPYSILCASPRSPHPNGILSQDSQVRVPKFPQPGLSRLWGPITLRAHLGLKWGLKQSCSHFRELSNDMLHGTCTQGNRIDSQLLVATNQITNLTLALSFGHNLCFKCPNGWYEPILNIYVSMSFQWYKRKFNPLGLDSCNRSLNIQESIETPTPKVGVPLGVWGSIPSHSLALPKACDMTPGLPSWPATLQPLALVINPRLRLRHIVLVVIVGKFNSPLSIYCNWKQK